MIDVVVRCRNEMPNTARTLAALARQASPRAKILFVDCTSSDGSRTAAVEHAATIIDLEPADYVPGRVLNRAMERTQSPVVAFVNADAVPLSDDALGCLIAPLANTDVAASFGRQLPRPTADRQTRLDHERAFGEGAALETARGRFFSMAASAIRRDAWERLRFDETLRYSEDVDWVQRASALGWRCAYAPEARFEKSREYDLRGHFRRRAGEGAADVLIHRLPSASCVDDWLRPLLGSLARDAAAGVASPRAIAVRLAQASGYYAGRRRGGQACSH